MEPNISSTSTFPTIIPKCLVANLKSDQRFSKDGWDFFCLKFLATYSVIPRYFFFKVLVLLIGPLSNLFDRPFLISLKELLQIYVIQYHYQLKV